MADEPIFKYENTPNPLTGETKLKNEASMMGYEEVTLPRERIYGGGIEIDSCHVRDLHQLLYDRFSDSLRRGGLPATMRHYTAAATGSGVLGAATIKGLKDLTAEAEKTTSFQGRKKLLEERIRPFLQTMQMKKTGGRK